MAGAKTEGEPNAVVVAIFGFRRNRHDVACFRLSGWNCCEFWIVLDRDALLTDAVCSEGTIKFHKVLNLVIRQEPCYIPGLLRSDRARLVLGIPHVAREVDDACVTILQLARISSRPVPARSKQYDFE